MILQISGINHLWVWMFLSLSFVPDWKSWDVSTTEFCPRLKVMSQTYLWGRAQWINPVSWMNPVAEPGDQTRWPNLVDEPCCWTRWHYLDCASLPTVLSILTVPALHSSMYVQVLYWKSHIESHYWQFQHCTLYQDCRIQIVLPDPDFVSSARILSVLTV